VRKLGGDIHVASRPGAGSTFQITLPLRQPEFVEESISSETHEVPVNTSTSLTSGSDFVSVHNEHTRPEARGRDSVPKLGGRGKYQDTGHGDSQAARSMLQNNESNEASTQATPKGATPVTLATIKERDESSSSLYTQYSSSFLRADETSWRKKIRVLSVDDDPTNQEVVRVVFREQKDRFDVHFAMSGKEALETLNSETFDCVLLDLMMPDMSGAEVLESIRRTTGISMLPVIVLTARGEHDVISDTLWKGATDYFMKPIDFNALFARIDQLVPIPDLSKKRIANVSPQVTPTDARTVTSSDDQSVHLAIGNHAALAVVFVSEHEATMSQFERAITFVERTATVAADRTCRNSDGSVLILAEGQDSYLRLQGIAREVQNYAHGGLKLSMGLSGPGDVQTVFIGEQLVASGTVIRNAVKMAWLNNRSGTGSNPGTPVHPDLEGYPAKAGPFKVSNGPSVEMISASSLETQVQPPLTQIQTVGLDMIAGPDKASAEMLLADVAHARIAYRLSRVLRDKCEMLREQCEQYETKLEQYSQRLSAISEGDTSDTTSKTIDGMKEGDLKAMSEMRERRVSGKMSGDTI
jgi:DNA-binding response OmpR family regulator